MRRWVIAAAVVVGVAGCGGGTPAIDGTIVRRDIGGQHAVILRSPTPKGRLVVYFHGARETAAAIVDDSQKRPLVRALLRHGFDIAATDAHGDSWGNPQSLSDYRTLIRTLHPKAVYFLAESMGGLDATMLIPEFKPAAWAGLFVVCDLREMYERGTFAASIRKAYGAGLGAHIGPRSPVASRAVKGLPMMFWASPGDRVAPKSANTDVCARNASQRGARVRVVTTRGDHSDSSNFDAAALLAFFDGS